MLTDSFQALQILVVAMSAGNFLFSEPMPTDKCFERALTLHRLAAPPMGPPVLQGIDAVFCQDPVAPKQ
jgi:hypothetical protein